MKRQWTPHPPVRLQTLAIRPRVEEVPAWEDFEAVAQELISGVMDLSLPMPDLLQLWGRVLSQRSRWQKLDAEGRVVWPQDEHALAGPGAHGPDAGELPAAGETPSNSEAENWKGKLQQVYAKHLCGRPVEKNEISYTVETVMGGRFQATVQAAALSGPITGEVSATKKHAEHSAARAAIYSDFPDFMAAADKTAAIQNPKMMLNQMLTTLLGRTATKDDTEYQTQERKSGKHIIFTSTVRFVPSL